MAFTNVPSDIKNLINNTICSQNAFGLGIVRKPGASLLNLLKPAPTEIPPNCLLTQSVDVQSSNLKNDINNKYTDMKNWVQTQFCFDSTKRHNTVQDIKKDARTFGEIYDWVYELHTNGMASIKSFIVADNERKTDFYSKVLKFLTKARDNALTPATKERFQTLMNKLTTAKLAVNGQLGHTGFSAAATNAQKPREKLLPTDKK